MKQWRILVCLFVMLVSGFGFGVGFTSWYVAHKGSNPVEIGREQEIVSAFHRIYHNNWWYRTVLNTSWMGMKTMQCPLDMWVLQEIIHETKPNVIIETGTNIGGSALFFANMLDLVGGDGRVISIDVVDFPEKPKHIRITYLVGSSTSERIVEQVRALIHPEDRVMVFLDSAHGMRHVLTELNLYSPLVSENCYLIVSDTHLNGHPIYSPTSPGPGPMEALSAWLPENHDFISDTSREKYGLTFSPKGYLRRK